ncbi:MAG: AraD1 family protein [Bacteroidota bacterium]
MTRLTQLFHPVHGRRIALVSEPELTLLHAFESLYQLAWTAIHEGVTVGKLVQDSLSSESLSYDSIHAGQADWQLLPAFDHPDYPERCLLSGTGLTHLSSAKNRQAMHEAAQSDSMTDSMRMYQLGEQGGKPAAGQVGAQPEWFFKGTGHLLRGHRKALEVPDYAHDGGEEAEIAGAYLIDETRQPWRVGVCPANEFSDHVLEKQNYLYLAPSKLRMAAIGPELTIGADLTAVSGTVQINRAGSTVWEQPIQSGESHMAHSLANLEHHHFKYAHHRIPGQVHIHFFGADAFSFGAGISLQDGDWMEVKWKGLGRKLSNPVLLPPGPENWQGVRELS